MSSLIRALQIVQAPARPNAYRVAVLLGSLLNRCLVLSVERGSKGSLRSILGEDQPSASECSSD